MSYPTRQDELNNKTKGVRMTTLIHCYHCQEDMNTPDWEANGGTCLHCNRPLNPDRPLLSRRFAPLARLRHRLMITEFVRSKPAYV